MTSVKQREKFISPSRYHRQTIGMVYSPPNSHSVPNSARHSTPRPWSALDRKWVHRSQGDLTLDMDFQAHPRLQSEFYQELYQKYPHAFRRRLESREAGRKLFNSCLHVRFKDDADVSDDNYGSHGNLRHLHSNTHLTNWDREVGHYLKHKSRSRECVTPVDPSECSESVLSVSQRLKLNSQSLNKLLNEDLPFRRHTHHENGQYDSGTENEQSLQDYMIEKSKERSRHRKQQRRIIIQRKIPKSESVDINKENERNSRRWMSKSVSPSRHLFSYSLQHKNFKKETHPVNVESLIADSDLKIETLLEKINAKMSGPESPPDSAIDVDTPSVQSLISSDLKGANLIKHDAELPSLNGEESGSFESPGSSASACVVENSAKFDDIMQEKVSTDTVQCSNDNVSLDKLTSDVNETTDSDGKVIISEEDEINKIVENYGNLENVNKDTGSGLLQLYTADMDNDNLGSRESGIGSPEKEIESPNHEEILEKDNDVSKVDEEKTTSAGLDIMYLDNADIGEEKIELTTDLDDITAFEDDINEEIDVTEKLESAHHVDHVDYNADDEHETDVMIAEALNSNSAMLKRLNTHRESDVDSGIGYSSTGTDTLPPRGRVQQRETTMKHQPFKGDHSLLPLRSEVDVDILDEVNLVHLSHDLLKSHDQRGRRGNSAIEERDDTDVRLGVSKASEKDKKIAEKYRRARSPSPYILRNRQSPSGCRPKSAPSFAKSELDVRVVDIPLSENSILASHGSQNIDIKGKALHSQPEPRIKNVKNTSKSNSCQNSDIISKYSSLPNLTGNHSKHANTHSSKSVSSKLVKQRKCSVSSISSKGSSISLLSENEADPNAQTCNLSYDDGMEDEVHSPEGAIEDDYAKDIEEEKFTEIEFDSGTNIESLAEQRPGELKKMFKGKYQPSVTSPRVKEKRLKIRNIMKQRKGTITPPMDSQKPSDEKSAINRIYAKARDLVDTYDILSRKPIDSLEVGAKSTFAAMISITKADLGSVEPGNDQTNAENTNVRTAPFDSAVSVSRDTDSVDENDKHNIAEHLSNDSNKVNVQVESVSQSQSQPPQKQRKETITPPVESKKPSDEKSALNRIYAKARDLADTYDILSRKPIDSLEVGAKSTFAAMISITKADLESIDPGNDQNNMENAVVRNTPFDTTSKHLENDKHNIAEHLSSNSNKVNEQVEKTVSRSKAHLPQKQRKETITPPLDSQKPSEEKSAINRIYAKARDLADTYDILSRKPIDSLEVGAKSTFAAMISITKADLGSVEPGNDQNNTENTNVKTTPFDSAVSISRDTDSVDKFISGDSGKTVKAEPVIIDTTRKHLKHEEPNIAENQSNDSNKFNEQVEKAFSPSKAQPPQKPVRTKHKNKDVNVLADQLNFSKYKIKLEGQPAPPLDNNVCTGTEKVKQSPRSQTSSTSDPKTEPSKTGPAQFSRGTSGESEIEEWKPLTSNVTSDNKAEKKRGSKGKFKMFKKALSMDRGIETVGMDPNPTGQNPQTSKDIHSNYPKVKKALSLKSFTSLFNRKKKKKGQFVIEDAENASKNASSLGKYEQMHPLSNGKQKHWASCHSLETMNSPIHHQPIRKQNTETSSTQQEIQPMGKLVKINPDGTQIIKLVKPENGPMGFFIAKGSAKFGNGIFVSRFTEERSEQSFAGLLGIGDEIIEVNNHVVRDLTQDAVYNLMIDKTVLLVKVFPFIARKDI